ncbi:MAG TPA: hypothetical protein VJS69_02405 [Candidatus Krumholzibacteria bacterium]|nr:hypothetical protein [Candidatus Krumholzibacteria bacterium]
MKNRPSEYTKRQEGTATVFQVIPASAPKFTYLLIIGAVCAFGGLISIASGFGIVFLLMGAFALWYGWTRDQRPKDHRVPSSFRVTPDQIDAGGRTFSKGDIHRLILKNGITDKELDVQQWTSNTNVAAGMAQRAKIAQVANSLNVETGGKSYLLAGGMDATTAYGLLHDVSKILGLNIS